MSVEEIRAKIDETDDALLELLLGRFALSLAMSKEKREAELPVFCPEREAEILARLTAHDPAFAKEITRIFTEIFNVSRDIQIDCK